MKKSFKKGLSFGLTSAVITTLGLMVGLNSGTKSQAVVIGGIIVIAVADALSDALGIHVSEEAEKNKSQREIWESTLATFVSKFVFTGIFVLPILLLPLQKAVIVSVIIGFVLVAVFSFVIAKKREVSAGPVVGEHVFIAAVVVVLTHFIGKWIESFS